MLLLLSASGCSAVSVDPVINDQRTATPATDSDREVVFLEPLSWANGPDDRATKAIFLPAGTYSLEAENEQFFYFRAPAQLRMGTYDRGTQTGGHEFVGGIAFAKSSLAQIPAEAYVSKTDTEKIHVMRFGYDFSKLRGKVWETRD